MIAATALSVAAWLVFGALGLPADPFLPLIAMLALHRDWPAAARTTAAIALGPVAAAACMDAPLERTAVYATVALLALQAGEQARDGVAVRTALAAVGVCAAVGTRALLSLGGAAAPPSETLATVAASVGWVAVHAALCRARR